MAIDHAPHAVFDMEPGESRNISVLVAFELTHASPQSFCSNEFAPENIRPMLVTSDTSHFDKSTLKELAPQNTPSILATFDTSHVDRSALKEVAVKNIRRIFVTLDTSQLDKSALKEFASQNIHPMLVTRDTSHLDRSALKELAPQNMHDMSLTRDTSHSAIAPCGPVEQSPLVDSSRQAFTALLSSSVVTSIGTEML